MTQNHISKKVFLLGAGFSKAVNSSYPLLQGRDSLTEKVIEKFDESYEKQSLVKHLDELPPVLHKNIEELLTYLNTDFPWKTKTQKKQNEALYEALTNAIVEEINSVPKNLRNMDSYLVNFIRQVNKKRYPVITLNYDTLFEELTQKYYEPQHSNEKIRYGDLYQIPIMDLHNRLGGSFWGSRNHNVHLCSHLLKLHGSTNWYFSEMNNTLYYEQDLIENEKYIKDDLIPYIIPPILDKNSFYNHQLIKVLWEKTHKYLETADEIYVIGFSLPQTDISVRFLLQSALRNNYAKIYFINTAKEVSLKKNYNILFKGKQTNTLWGDIRNYDYCGFVNPLKKFITEKFLVEEGVRA